MATFDQAQQAFDMQEHPQYWDCDENGHDPVCYGCAEDGTEFHKCRRCGEDLGGM